MSIKPVLLRPAALADIDAAIDYYRSEGGESLASRWVAELSGALEHVGLRPGTGSLRYERLALLTGLRFWPMKRFPYLVFYVEQRQEVDVWRVLHAQRDVPERLQADDLGDPA